MSTDNEEGNEEVEEPKEVIEAPKDDEKVTLAHLKELMDHVDARFAEVRKDKSKDDEEKADLRAQLEETKQKLEDRIKQEEDKDKLKENESTIVVPPSELDISKNQNQVPQEQEPDSNGQVKKRKLSWW